MNKTVMAALAVALMASFTAEANALDLTVGGRGGFNLADIHGADADDEVPIKGFGLGAFALVGISDQLSVQLEGLWMEKGAEDEITKLKLHADYLEFPLTVVGKLPVGDYTQIIAFGGPVLSYLVRTDSERDLAMGGDGDVKDELKSVDVGGTFGLGAWFDSESMLFTVDVRWTFGFSSISDLAPNPEKKNNVISLFAGVGFPLGI